MMETMLDKLQLNTETYLPFLEKNKRAVYSISAAITITAFSRYIYTTFIIPPKNLRHLPYVSYYDIIKAALKKGETMRERKDRVVLGLLDKADGLYLVPSNVGWELQSTNPKYNKILSTDIELFPKDQNVFGAEGSLVHKFVGGKGIASTDGEDWKRHRKVTNPAFHRALPVKIFGQLSQNAFEMMEKIGLDNFTCMNICDRMTLDAVGLGGFDFDFRTTKDLNSEWLQDYNNIKDKMVSVFFILFQLFDTKLRWLFPSRVHAHRQLDHLLGKIDNMIVRKRQLIQERIQDPASYPSIPDSEKDFLTLMIEAELQGEGKLTDLELRRNIATLFFAGQDTTSGALSFAIGQLARDKQLQQRAREEALSVLGNEPKDILPTVQDLKQMPFIDAIVKETLRTSPPFSKNLLRITTKEILLGSNVIPKGTHVSIDIMGTHFSEKNWENPTRFNPERYLDQPNATSSKEGVKYATFGYGSHQCPGANFSMAEQKVFIAMLLRKFEFELTNDSIHKKEVIAGGFAGIIKPVDLRVNFKKRY